MPTEKAKIETEEVVKVASETKIEEAQQAPKRRGRGVANTTGTQKLRFSHLDANPKVGLFTMQLDSVEVSEVEISEEVKNMPSFAGLKIPKLYFNFVSTHEDSKKRHISLEFMPVESTALTIPKGKENWKVNYAFDYLKHIYDIYVLKGTRDFNEEEADALELPFFDFDDEGNYIPVESEEVVKGWGHVFNNFANLMNTGKEGSPVFKTKDGKPIVLWAKLIRYYRKNNTNKWENAKKDQSLAFPSRVGTGVFELYKRESAPTLRFDVLKERLNPKTEEEIKAENINKTPGIPSMPGSGIQMPNIADLGSSGFEDVGSGPTDFGGTDDLPF